MNETLQPVDKARLQRLLQGRLASGAHNGDSGDDGIANGCCFMEGEAWIRRRPWTDHDPTACPVIGAMMRSLNDGLPDAPRNDLLKPFLGRIAGTRASERVENRRAAMAADFYARVWVPAVLRLNDGAEFQSCADQFAALPGFKTLQEIPAAVSINLEPVEAAASDAIAALAALAAIAASDARAAIAASDAIARDAAVYKPVFVAAESVVRSGGTYWDAYLAARRVVVTLDERAFDVASAVMAHAKLNEQVQATGRAMDQAAVDLVERMLAVTDEAPQ